jgi:YHS domain-containing protein
MFRALIELVVTIIIAMAARAILASVFRGFSGAVPRSPAGRSAQQSSSSQPPPEPRNTGELHKDPVCGTYVAESTPFKRQISGHTVYYCSGACRDKHALVA